MKTFLRLLCLLLIGGQVSATHLRGGYIQTRSISGLSYEITATIYQEGSASVSVDESITVCFGDGTTQAVARQSLRFSSDGILGISTYRLVHTYAGPGTYTIATSLASRTPSLNIVTTTQEPLTLTTTILTGSSGNRTPTLLLPQTSFRVGINQRLVFPLKATDDEGDSLVYALTLPRTSSSGNPCVSRTISPYQYPNDLARRGTFKIDRRTGDLTWDAPTQPGYFSVAITVSEYRNGLLISQTNEEFTLIIVDQPGTPAIIPPYEPALEGGIVTALPVYRDEDALLTVFPNPVDDRLQVVVQTSNPTTARTQLLDSNGRILHELSFGRSARKHEQVISMSSLTPGQYILRADVGGQILLRKVVKK